MEWNRSPGINLELETVKANRLYWKTIKVLRMSLKWPGTGLDRTFIGIGFAID